MAGRRIPPTLHPGTATSGTTSPTELGGCHSAAFVPRQRHQIRLVSLTAGIQHRHRLRAREPSNEADFSDLLCRGPRMFGRWLGSGQPNGQACTPGGVKARFSRELAQLGVRVRDRDPAFGAGGGYFLLLAGTQREVLTRCPGGGRRRRASGGTPSQARRGSSHGAVAESRSASRLSFRCVPAAYSSRGRPWA
jgi:hypothetical protein